MTSPIIRRAEAGDLPQLCGLYHAFHEFHVQGVPDRLASLGPTPTFDCAEVTAALQGILAQLDAALFVAVENGAAVNGTAERLLGLAEVYVCQDKPGPAVVAHRYGHLQSLFVDVAHRGRHLGTTLLAAAEHWAAEQGATELRLDTWEFAVGPLPFYEQHGYRTLGRTLVRWITPSGAE